MKYVFSILFFLTVFFVSAQKNTTAISSRKYVVSDSIKIDSVSINSSFFKVFSLDGKRIDSTKFTVDFSKSVLVFNKDVKLDSIKIQYLKYPDYLTKEYKQLDESIIVTKTDKTKRLFKLEDNISKPVFTPFDGLTTSGSISRGVTIGNNQNSVLNSELDLQISGKLSDKVTLKASIQDANIPLQEGGYSQRLDEFDQVFIELQSKNWQIRAGDIDLINSTSNFLRFSKRVQGLLVNANLSTKTSVFASGALVRGQFTTTQFTAQEGNQGPYKLRGPNNELFVLIVSGSETVYVNGIPLERGENNDYIIDYNAGEIIFNSTFPVTSEMRVTVDYQFSDRNYSRFIAYAGGNYTSEKLKFDVNVYSESDAKNQPLQQNLSSDQIAVLAEAGDNRNAMVASSATSEAFSENRILYRKDIINGNEVFVFSNNPDDDLFNVRFTLVGDNQGDYVLSNENAVTNIYEYIAPLNGISQGNYAPIVQLIAPERLQVAAIHGTYNPTEKTAIYFEIAGSKKDLNLFSDIDDNDNNGFAAKLRLTQNVIKTDSLWNLKTILDADVIQEDFRSVERIYRPEFNRDWNINEALDNEGNFNLGNQVLASGNLELSHSKNGRLIYGVEFLNYSNDFNANRHNLLSDLRYKRFTFFTNTSYLTNNNVNDKSTFFRSFNRVSYALKNKWIGAKYATENNKQRNKVTDSLTILSQKFNAIEGFVGVGDSTKIFLELGYIKRFNDSLRANKIQRVNSSDTYYLKSRLLQNTNSQLQLYVNYRNLKSELNNTNEQSINSRLNYSQKLFNNLIILNTNFETNSGTLPQQDFTYVEVEPGQGTYTWIDYNENGIQELEEFEIAQFQDQGSFIRVLLPNQVFVRTHQNRWSQTLTFNAAKWSSSKNKTKKIISHFYNQTSFLIDRKVRREGNNFSLNPFKSNENNQLGLNTSIRNVIFYNRGKQRYTTSYTYLNNINRSLLSIGLQENKQESHQLNFVHKIAKTWLIQSLISNTIEESFNDNFSNRNFEIEEQNLFPKLSYLFNDNAQFDVFYQYTSKSNTIGALETLKQQNYGVSFTYNNAEKIALNGTFNYFENTFEGNVNTPVAFQMLEGLQPGKNFTWSLLAQKKLTKFLDLNINYFGRKTESSNTIHTGTVQLRAYF